MKITKGTTSIILSLFILVSIFTSLIIPTNALSTYPNNRDITLHIHKYALPDHNNNKDNYIKNDPDGYISADKELTLNDLPNGSVPLKDVEFKVSKVGEINTKISEVQDENGLLKEGVVATSEQRKTTNSNGEVTFTVGGNAHGLYYVEETRKPNNITTYSKPFFVYLPLTNPTGNGWLTDVHVYPKNIYTLGSAVFTKKFETAKDTYNTIEQSGMSFKENENTVIGFYSMQGSSPNSDNDKLLAEITLSNNDQQQPRYVELTQYAQNNEPFNSIEIQEYKGTIIVNGLTPANGDYYFREIKGGTNSDGTKYETNTNEIMAVPVTGDSSSVRFNEHNQVEKLNQNGESVGNNANVVDVTLNNYKLPTFKKYVENADKQQIPANKVLSAYNPDHNSEDNTSDVETSIVNSKDPFYFVLEADVPATINNYKKFIIEDQIKNYFMIDTASSYYEVSCDKNVQLIEGTHYRFTNDNGNLRFELLPEGLNELNGATKLYVRIKAQLNTNFSANDGNTKFEDLSNKALENTATLTYEPQTDAIGTIDATAYVGFFGAKIQKVDGETGEALAGAQFELKLHGDENALNVLDLGDNKYALTSEETGVKIESGSEGNITIYGLEDKAYTLTETKSPTGYQLLKEPVTLNIDEDSYSDPSDNRIIKNFRQPYLPATGGIGTIAFTIAGLALLIGGLVMFFVYKRKEDKENETN